MNRYPIPRAALWPNVGWDTTDPAGMAKAQAWLEALLSRETPPPGPHTPEPSQKRSHRHTETVTYDQPARYTENT